MRARRWKTGVTTVRDLGAADYADIAMRDLIAQGQMPGPRMFVAGYGLLITRGRTPSPNTADGVAEVLRVVRQQVAAGADVIKMYGSTGSGRDVTGFQTFTFEEMKAAVERGPRARQTHRHPHVRPRWRARRGTRRRRQYRACDRHGRRYDRRDGTPQDLLRTHHRSQSLLRRQLPQAQLSALGGGRLQGYIARNLETARQAFRGGVRFAMGSDAVYTMFGENTRELGWFVKAE
jgi:hypothetical protein